MGLTEGTVHVKASGLPLERVADAVRAIVGDSGQWEEAGGTVEREILIWRDEAQDWIGLKDSGQEAEDSLASELSARLECVGLQTFVEDSARFSATLFARGRKECGIRASVGRRGISGKAERWLELLPELKAEEWTQTLGADLLFAEQYRNSLLRMLGLSAQAHSDRSAGMIRLGFRLIRAAAAENEKPFLLAGTYQSLPTQVGQPCPALLFQFANRGGLTKGVTVRFAGPAIKEGLLEIQGMRQILLTDEIPEVRNYLIRPEAPDWEIVLPEIEIPHQEDPQKIKSGKSMRQYMRQWMRKQVCLALVAVGVKKGEAVLAVRVSCLNNPEVAASFEIPVRVDSA